MSRCIPYGRFKWSKNADNSDVNSIIENSPIQVLSHGRGEGGRGGGGGLRGCYALNYRLEKLFILSILCRKTVTTT